MDPLSLGLGVTKAFLEFLCTPEGQEFCKTNRENLKKFADKWETLIGKIPPLTLPPFPKVGG